MLITKRPNNQRLGSNVHTTNLIDGLVGLNGTCRHLLATLIVGAEIPFECEKTQPKEEDSEWASTHC